MPIFVWLRFNETKFKIPLKTMIRSKIKFKMMFDTKPIIPPHQRITVCYVPYID